MDCHPARSKKLTTNNQPARKGREGTPERAIPFPHKPPPESPAYESRAANFSDFSIQVADPKAACLKRIPVHRQIVLRVPFDLLSTLQDGSILNWKSMIAEEHRRYCLKVCYE